MLLISLYSTNTALKAKIEISNKQTIEAKEARGRRAGKTSWHVELTQLLPPRPPARPAASPSSSLIGALCVYMERVSFCSSEPHFPLDGIIWCCCWRLVQPLSILSEPVIKRDLHTIIAMSFRHHLGSPPSVSVCLEVSFVSFGDVLRKIRERKRRSFLCRVENEGENFSRRLMSVRRLKIPLFSRPQCR